MAFVALAQSCGRASEASAVLHLANAKEETELVSTMLDVRSLINLARETAEKRSRSRSRERYRSSGLHGDRVQDGGDQSSRRARPSTRLETRGLERRIQNEGDQQIPDSEESLAANGTQGTECYRALRKDVLELGGNKADMRPPDMHDTYDHPGSTRHGGRDARNSEDGGSDSAPPTILPPLVGLVQGSPPTPETLKTVLSTSTSVAVGIPVGFGLSRKSSERVVDPEYLVVSEKRSKMTRWVLKINLHVPINT